MEGFDYMGEEREVEDFMDVMVEHDNGGEAGGEDFADEYERVCFPILWFTSINQKSWRIQYKYWSILKI